MPNSSASRGRPRPVGVLTKPILPWNKRGSNILSRGICTRTMYLPSSASRGVFRNQHPLVTFWIPVCVIQELYSHLYLSSDKYSHAPRWLILTKIIKADSFQHPPCVGHFALDKIQICRGRNLWRQGMKILPEGNHILRAMYTNERKGNTSTYTMLYHLIIHQLSFSHLRT